jgi:hypothetical protein
MRSFVTRAIPFLLAAAISMPASPQIARAPQPVMRNPNAPRPPVGHPDPLPTSEPSGNYTVLAFTIWTGDDDLRANSTVGADLHFSDGTTHHCDLRPGNESWNDHSIHPGAPCALPASKGLGELKDTKIDLVYNGDPHAAINVKKSTEANFDTFDNWNVARVRIEAQNPAQHQKACLLDVKSDPLVRMKETNSSFRLTDVMSSC